MKHHILVNERSVGGQRHFGVLFEDGSKDGVRVDYTVASVDDLKRRIRADDERLSQAADLEGIPVDGEVDTALPVVAPTERDLFNAARRKLEQARACIALAGDAGAKIDVAALEADFVAKFKAEFL